MEQQILIIIVSQVISAIGIIAAIKTDIGWVKSIQQQHGERLTALEARCFHARKTDKEAAN